jgi:hypothetical protein
MRNRAVVGALLAFLVTFAGFAGMAACGELGSPASLRPTGTISFSTDASGEACTQFVMPDGGPVHITGTVLEATKDDDASTPIPGAMIAVEYAPSYTAWCDLASASPYYVFGAVTDDAGRFELDAREGDLGLHGFANDHLYGTEDINTTKTKTVVLRMRGILPRTQAKPRVTGAGFDKASVAPGENVTFSATLATWDPKDPLSDESVLVEPTQSWCLELNPPSRGKKDDFADGLWKREFRAPTKPGTYTYWFSATTATCITSDLVTTTLTVR